MDIKFEAVYKRWSQRNIIECFVMNRRMRVLSNEVKSVES